MRTTTRKVARATVVGGTTIAVSVLVFACALQSDNPISPKPRTGARSLQRGPLAVSDSQTYFEFQVEKAVSVAAGNPRPEFPATLRAASIEGEVLAQFVADTFGLADMRTFKVLKSSHDLFTDAVRTVLPNMRFNSALVGNRKVKQLVQMPFQFRLSNGATSGAAVRPDGNAPVFVKAATPVPAGGTGTFFEFQVTRQAKPKVDNPMPRYPDELRMAKIEGEVLAQFVVGEDGRANPETLKILKTSHDLFSEAVRKALPTMQFDAAQSNGRNVKQLLQMPFTFSLSK